MHTSKRKENESLQADPQAAMLLHAQPHHRLTQTQENRNQLPPNQSDVAGGRFVLQTSIVVLDVAFSIAETIPVFGAPLKGALEALCKVLKLVEQRFRIGDDIEALTERLTELMKSLCRAGTPDDVLKRLIRRINAIERNLQGMLASPGIRYPVIAQFISGCNDEINLCSSHCFAWLVTSPDLLGHNALPSITISLYCRH
ncbi:hypothetical protein NMY22_g10063 [Coprinellus aureogranulatus]|nr:hypothetical protein NMY22_g10063 [Coprinellus aureogranulatus]